MLHAHFGLIPTSRVTSQPPSLRDIKNKGSAVYAAYPVCMLTHFCSSTGISEAASKGTTESGMSPACP